MDPSGKVAVVTGAASGIGAALARELSRAGAVVVLADVDEVGLRRLASELDTLAVTTDVASEPDNLRLIEESESQAGPVDLFFANAGIAFEGSEQSPDDDWERMWRVNFLSHVFAARHLIPRWRDRGGGYLVVTASAAGLLTNIGAAQYAVTKHAAVAFAEWLSVTYGDEGIIVSCLCPQGVLTPILEKEGEAISLLRATALTPEAVAAEVLEGIRREQFLILPHPEVAGYEQRRAADRDSWLEGMRRLRRNLRSE